MKLNRYLKRPFWVTFSLILLASLGNAAIIVQTDDDWRVTETPNALAGWNSDVGFDDSSWDQALEVYNLAPHGYDPDTYGIWDQSGQFSNVNNIVARQTFTVSGTITSAFISGAFDDDGRVYINGTEVYSDTNGSATGYNFDVSSYLVQGTNLIAIEAINNPVHGSNHSAWLELDAEVAAVPEPSSLSLFALSGLLLLRRRKSKK